jgi:peptidoglycan/LPS O-acetylase OafA/YrhL
MTELGVGPGMDGDETPSPSAVTLGRVTSAGVSEERGFGRVRGLDGIRGMAVLGVLGYHAGVSWLGGGLQGLDEFFALSGFLITSLLAAEYRRSGTIRLRQFYVRRARRLVPALLVMLLIVAFYAVYFAEPDTLSTLRGDALSTLGYVANWRFILDGSNYFVQFGPVSPLVHTWSLAIEEQFYLVWPFVTLFVLRKRGPKTLSLVAAALVLASVTECIVLFHTGASATRLYFGTDTHGQSLMVGACLGAFASTWSGFSPDAGTGPNRRRLLLGAAGALGLAYCVWAFVNVQGGSSYLFDGGFLAMAVATGAVMMTVVYVPKALVTRIFSFPPLMYVGRISYGIYLYHWPLFLMINQLHTGLGGWQLLAARFAATGAVSVLSFHLIEQPIRQHRFNRRWVLRALTPAAIGGTVIALVASTSGSVPTFGTGPVTLPPTTAHVTASCSYVTRGAVCATPRTAARAGLASDNPVRMMIFGDSIAITLAEGLAFDAGHWDVSVDDKGAIGCDLDPNSTVNIQGSITQAAQGCVDWQQRWAALVKKYDPDVVAIELGRWEVSDRIVNGHWTAIGRPVWDRLLAKLLNEAITISSRHGAKVVLFTLPYIQQTTEQPDGLPWDINTPGRTNAYNAVVRRVVAGRSKAATVINLNRMLDPNGHYTSYIGGIRVRDVDDEHISPLGGIYLRPLILPEISGLGLSHAIARQASNAKSAEHR